MLDATLIRRMQRGEEEALGELRNRYQSYVCTILSAMVSGTGTYADVEELCADTFYSVWRSAQAIRPGKLKQYLAAAARNKAKSWLRARRELPMDLDTLDIPDGTLPLEERAMEQELAQRVRQAVRAMKPGDREIFLRYYYYLQPTAVIAAALEMPESTVRSRLHRGRLALKEFLCQEDLP